MSNVPLFVEEEKFKKKIQKGKQDFNYHKNKKQKKWKRKEKKDYF